MKVTKWQFGGQQSSFHNPHHITFHPIQGSSKRGCHRVSDNKLIRRILKTLPTQHTPLAFLSSPNTIPHPRKRNPILLTLCKFPTTSSNAGAKLELTYKNTLSISPTFNTLLKYATTASNLCELEILHTCCLNCGALPTGLNLTVTFALRNVPAEERALAASRGSAVRIMEEAMVSGRSGSVVEESGIAFTFAFSVGVDVREGVWRGEDIFACLRCFVGCVWRVGWFGMVLMFRTRLEGCSFRSR